MGRVSTETATIAASAYLSNAIKIEDYTNIAIQIPSAWTTAGISFAGCSTSDGTFGSIYGDDGQEITIDVAASRAIALDVFKKAIKNFPYIKIRSGTSGTPVNQAAERAITIYLSN